MGTWGPGVFASDYAQDYLDELAELPEGERLTELARVLLIAAEEPASMPHHGLFGAVILTAAGVVADSVPENEWQETENKARAVLRAAELVQAGLDGQI